ncbi:MAG: acyloxyacyl hydrolase [Endozoicomonas sp.]
MKVGLHLLGLICCLTWGHANAFDLTPDRLNVSYGQYLPVVSDRGAEFNNYRLGLTWNLTDSLYESDSIRLGAYYEVAGSSFQSRLTSSDNPSPDGKDQATVFSFSPVLRLTSSDSLWGTTSPYFDAGVGAAWLSEKDLEKKKKSPINMGGHWQFEIRFMAGLMFGERQQYELGYGWLHYSNAGLNGQNESIDFQAITFGWSW